MEESELKILVKKGVSESDFVLECFAKATIAGKHPCVLHGGHDGMLEPKCNEANRKYVKL